VFNRVEIQVNLGMEGLPKDHPACIEATEEFLHDVQEQPGIAVEERSVPAQPSATKGAAQELLLAPGTAGLSLAAVKIIKLWLSRDRRRTIDVSIKGLGDAPLSLHASGEHISLETLEDTVRRALDTQSDRT
jgi:hypothetical protein